MTTGNDVVLAALMKAGVLGKGRPADSFDSNNALADLNDMIAAWNTKRWLIWDLLDLSIVSTGAATYTIGPAGDINISRRPDKLQAGYVKQIVNTGLPVNTPLEVIQAREQWSRLSLPQLVSFPEYLFLDTAWPLGVLHVYPIPNSTLYEIHVIVRNVITDIAMDTDLGVLPSHYIPAFKFNLAKILRQAYGRGGKPDGELNRQARFYRDAVIESNLQIAELVMPKVLIAQSSGYNILSDQFGQG